MTTNEKIARIRQLMRAIRYRLSSSQAATRT